MGQSLNLSNNNGRKKRNKKKKITHEEVAWKIRDLENWRATDFCYYFNHKFSETFPKGFPPFVNVESKSKMKRLIEKTNDHKLVKDVIDWLFDNWEDNKKHFSLRDPSIGLICSGFFSSFVNKMKGVSFSKRGSTNAQDRCSRTDDESLHQF